MPRPSLVGLGYASQPINNQDDPLGAYAQRRGLESYMQGTADEAAAGNLGSVVMPTPDMAGLTQVLAEKNARVAPSKDLFAAPHASPNDVMSTDDAIKAAEFYRKNPNTPLPNSVLQGIKGAMS